MENKDFCNCEINRLTVGVVKKIRKKQDEFLSPFGLTHYHATYIENLDRFGELSMGDLTDLTNTDKANTTRVIRDLLDKDVVTKHGGERKFVITLSEFGKQIAKDFRLKVCMFMKKVMDRFEQNDILKLKELLTRMFEGLTHAIEEA